jgi:hypothetical protein
MRQQARPISLQICCTVIALIESFRPLIVRIALIHSLNAGLSVGGRASHYRDEH